MAASSVKFTVDATADSDTTYEPAGFMGATRAKSSEPSHFVRSGWVVSTSADAKWALLNHGSAVTHGTIRTR